MVFYQTESSEKESQHQRTKKLNFGLEPSVKFVSHISGLVSKRKNGGQIFSNFFPNRGWSEGGMVREAPTNC